MDDQTPTPEEHTMTRTLTTAAAAALAGTTPATIRAWCRRGAVAAAKTGRGWAVELAALLRRLNGELPAVAGYLRTGQWEPVRTGRAARRYEARHTARTASSARRQREESPRPGARPATHVQRALVAVHNAGWFTTVDYLHAIGFPEAERYASAFGRVAAKRHRTVHGVNPYGGCLAIVNGRLRKVFGYADVADLQAAAYSYARTREFLNGQRTAALHALAA